MKTKLLEKIIKDAVLRRALTRRSHSWFFHVFLSSYIEYKTALFQEEMFRLTQSERHKLVAVMAFRGSGKSTIMNLSYSLWSVLGVQQKKFVVIVSKTQVQAKSHFLNIRTELENNELLSLDLGPFRADEDAWGLHAITLSRLDAKIAAISREQSLRGLRHGTNRPDLIICDDIEDSVSVASADELDRTYRWFQNEVIPAGDDKVKVVLLGNLLHENSLLMRIKKDIQEKRVKGIFRAYPLLDNDGRILWPDKFRSEADIKALKARFSDEKAWEAEYLLKLLSPTAPIRPLFDVLKDPENEEEHKKPRQKLGPYRISAPTVYGPGIPIARKIWGKLSKKKDQEDIEPKQDEN